MLAVLGQQLAAQDPELAEQFNQPPVPLRETWAARLASVMLVAGVVMLSSGIMFAATGAGVLGAVLLLTCWMPPRIVAPHTP